MVWAVKINGNNPKMKRRTFCISIAKAYCILPFLSLIACKKNKKKKGKKDMSITQPPLPYEKNALQPHISEKTLEFHYNKHHAGYVAKLNGFIENTPFASLTLEEIIQKAHQEKNTPIFNNAAQTWNHTFFWNSMKPNGGGNPTPEFKNKIEQAFSSVEKFKEEFKAAAISQFGSGWAWLVSEGGKLKIVKTANADLPLIHGQKALFTIDVWEHAYYLDYQNKRPDFVQAILDHLINWDFIEKNLQA